MLQDNQITLAPPIAPIRPRPFWQRHSQWLAPACIVLYWLINLVFISPAGNFPLNDDWIYSESVSYFMKTNQFHLLGGAPSCFLHVALGSALCSIFGYSDAVLRTMTVCFGLAAALAIYAGLRNLEVKREAAALFAMLLAANPLFVNLSYSFMTDVPSLCFACLYVVFMVRALQRQSACDAGWASLMLCCAILFRQTFVVLSGCTLLMLLVGRYNSRGMQITVAIGAIAPLAVASIAERLLLASSEYAFVYQWHRSQMLGQALSLFQTPLTAGPALVERLFKIFCYFSLFLAPVIPAIATHLVKQLRERNKLTIGVFTVALVTAVVCFVHTVRFEHQLMPFNQNLLRIPMLGPLNLMGICVAGLKDRQRLWLTIACALAAVPLIASTILFVLQAARRTALLLSERFNKRQVLQSNQSHDLTAIFACSMLIATLGFVSIQTGYLDFDRYYLMAAPALLLCVGLFCQRSGVKQIWKVAIPLTIALAGYSSFATQDYMSWNRARWQAIKELEGAGITARQIDGGPEYNYPVNANLVNSWRLGSGYAIVNRGAPPRCNWRWWPINGEDYIISFSPVPEYDIIARHKFWGGLSLSYRDVLTLKHVVPKTPGSPALSRR
jgi:hypothetical protein